MNGTRSETVLRQLSRCPCPCLLGLLALQQEQEVLDGQ